METEPHVSSLSTRMVPVCLWKLDLFSLNELGIRSDRSTVRGRDHSVETNETRNEFFKQQNKI